jgi:RNA polymerase sigma factor (sigma-70 family)
MFQEYKSWSDEKLMGSYQSGNDIAFKVLYDRHKARVKGFLFQKIRNAAAAEDICQDSFIRLINSRGQYVPSMPFKPWFNQISRNAMIDYFRKHKDKGIKDPYETMSREYTDDHEPVEGFEAEYNKFDKHEASQRPEAEALTELAELSGFNSQQVEVIKLRLYEGYAFDEIAKKLNITAANARKILERALDRVAKGRNV